MYVHLHVNHRRYLRPDGKSTQFKEFICTESERKGASLRKKKYSTKMIAVKMVKC